MMANELAGRSDAYWAGYLAEHLRAVLAHTDTATTLAAAALADFDAYCAEDACNIPGCDHLRSSRGYDLHGPTR